jgi:hypothetical protein
VLDTTVGKAEHFIEWVGLAIPVGPGLVYEPAELYNIYNKKAGLTGLCCTLRVGLCCTLKLGPSLMWKRWSLHYLERLASTTPSGMASILPRTWPVLYLEALVSALPGKADLCCTFRDGLCCTKRAGLHYTWKGWPPLYLERLASAVPGGPPNSGGWRGQFWPLFLPGDQAPPPPQSPDLLKHKHK